MFDPKKVKQDFPIFKRKFNGKELVYLDNAASSQKPQQVIDTISDFYENHYANVHRGIYTLSEEASGMYEDARKKVAEFIGAVRAKEIIFTSGATESLNMVVLSWALNNLRDGDIIMVSEVEHHSNLVPWQMIAEKTGAELCVLKCRPGKKDTLLAKVRANLNDRVKIVSVAHASNVTGEIFPVKEISKEVKKVGALLCVDGAQAVPHIKVNVQSLGCDFYAFSAHKMLGPTGVGVLWVRGELYQQMEPYKYGGGMIYEVKEKSATWADPPERFEAGTQNIAGVVGLASAIDYLGKLGLEQVREHEVKLNEYTLKTLPEIEELKIIGPKDPQRRTGLVSFAIEGVHAHDLAAILNTEGIAVRSGHHCAMPLHTKLNLPASTRASYYIYNTEEDIDKLMKGIYKAIRILK